MTKNLILFFLSFLFIYGCSSSTDSNNNTNTTSVTDIDGNTYQTVQICDQTWTKSNLNVSHYRNGDVIPQVTNTAQWGALTTGAWCYYVRADGSTDGPTYGKLYNWHAVNDPRGLAPEGWHIPSGDEWDELVFNCLGGWQLASDKMRETGTQHWLNQSDSVSNSSGFTALPGGFRYHDGIFYGLRGEGRWWSSTEEGFSQVYAKYIGLAGWGTISRTQTLCTVGMSIRCVKD